MLLDWFIGALLGVCETAYPVATKVVSGPRRGRKATVAPGVLPIKKPQPSEPGRG